VALGRSVIVERAEKAARSLEGGHASPGTGEASNAPPGRRPPQPSGCPKGDGRFCRSAPARARPGLSCDPTAKRPHLGGRSRDSWHI
jgi:hypothetical protein